WAVRPKRRSGPSTFRSTASTRSGRASRTARRSRTSRSTCSSRTSPPAPSTPQESSSSATSSSDDARDGADANVLSDPLARSRFTLDEHGRPVAPENATTVVLPGNEFDSDRAEAFLARQSYRTFAQRTLTLADL